MSSFLMPGQRERAPVVSEDTDYFQGYGQNEYFD